MTVNPAGIREEEAAVAIVFSFPLGVTSSYPRRYTPFSMLIMRLV